MNVPPSVRPQPQETEPDRSRPLRRGGPAPCVDVRSVALTGLFIIACLWFLHAAATLVVPLTLALLLHFLLIPVVRAMKRYRLPEPVAAAVVLLAVTGGVATAGQQLANPALEWVERAPQAIRTIEQKLHPVRESMAQVSHATQALDRAAQGGGQDSIRRVKIHTDWQTPMVNLTGQVLGAIGTTLLLLYFLLASGDLFLGKMMRVLSRQEDRDCAIRIVTGVERQLSRYLFQTLLIQAGLGIALWLVLWALGMPNPGLWAAAAAVLQIIPYIGSLLVLIMIAIVSAVTFDQAWMMAAPVLAYLGLTFLKGFVTPVFLGRRLVLNRVAVLVSLIFFGWMWGVTGTLLAVPLLASLKIMCDHIAGLQALGEFLAE